MTNREWLASLSDEVVLYAGMMKAICELNKATPEQKARAQEWLTKRLTVMCSRPKERKAKEGERMKGICKTDNRNDSDAFKW